MSSLPDSAQRYSCPQCRSVYRTSFPRCFFDGTALAPMRDDPLVGTTLVGRYVIEACVGEGGMSRIYRAQHRFMSRRYAIKILFGELAADEKMRNRFAQEAEAACRLSHPNVVSVVDVGTTDSQQAYLVMDFVDGRTLKEIIESEAPMSRQRITNLLWQLGSGLNHAHDKGLVHRDFKPANVMVVNDGRGEVPKILDFGIARINEDGWDNEVTTSGMVMGTPAYMSPEHALGDELDGRSDMFSLGVVLYQMLSGVLPFTGPGSQVVQKNLSAPVPPIAERRPGLQIDTELESLALRLMAKQPQQRFQSGQHLVQELADRALISADTARDPRFTSLGASAQSPAGHNQRRQGPTGQNPGGSSSSLPSLVHVDNWQSSASQQWTTDAVPGDETMYLGVPGGRRTRWGLWLALIATVLGGVLAVLLIGGDNSPATPPDAGVHDRDAAVHDRDVAVAPVANIADASPPQLDAASPPDASTGKKNVPRRPRTISYKQFRALYQQVGRTVHRLVERRPKSSAAEKLRDEYFQLEPEDAADDPAMRRQLHKQLKSIKARADRQLRK